MKARRTQTVSFSIPTDLLTVVDEWRTAQQIKPSRSATLVAALRLFLEQQGTEPPPHHSR